MFTEVQERPLQTKPAVNGRELMRTWLQTKDPGEAYDWSNPDTCLMTLFIRDTGATAAQTGDLTNVGYIAQGPKPQTMEEYYSRSRHWTFGQAFARLREVS